MQYYKDVNYYKNPYVLYDKDGKVVYDNLTSEISDEVHTELEKAKAEIGDKAKSDEDVLSYIAFPTQAEAFFDKREEKARNTFKYTIREV